MGGAGDVFRRNAPNPRHKRRKLREDSRHLSSASASHASAGAGGPSGAPLGLYHCDSCHRDLSGALRIRCAVCADFDLCLDCFSVGAEVHPHRNDHAYRVVESLAFPIFEPGWRADEELQLLESAAKFGLGNWARIATVVGKSEDVCRDHYRRIYLDGVIKGEANAERGAEAARGAAGAEDGVGAGQGVAAPGTVPVSPSSVSPTLPAVSPAGASSSGAAPKKEPPMPETSDAGSRAPQPSLVPPPPPPFLPAIATPRPEAPDVPTFAPGPSTAETPTLGARPRRCADEIGRGAREGGAKAEGAAGAEVATGPRPASTSQTPSPPLRPCPASLPAPSPPAPPPPPPRPPSPSPSPGPQSPSPAPSSAGPSPPALAAADVAQTGFHAKRFEFDIEYDNEAEHLIADVEPNAADAPEVREAKLRLLDAYNRRLSERVRRREWLLERNAVAVRRFSALERKRTAPERELAAQLRVFSRFMEPEEHSALVEGLLVEQRLRARIAELQQLRAAGLRTFEEADKAAAAAEALAEARRKGGYGAAATPGSGAAAQAGLAGGALGARPGSGRPGAAGLGAGGAGGGGGPGPAGAARSGRSSARAGGTARRGAAPAGGTSGSLAAGAAAAPGAGNFAAGAATAVALAVPLALATAGVASGPASLVSATAGLASGPAPGTPGSAPGPAPGAPSSASGSAPGAPSSASGSAPGAPSSAPGPAPGAPSSASGSAPGAANGPALGAPGAAKGPAPGIAGPASLRGPLAPANPLTAGFDAAPAPPAPPALAAPPAGTPAPGPLARAAEGVRGSSESAPGGGTPIATGSIEGLVVGISSAGPESVPLRLGAATSDAAAPREQAKGLAIAESPLAASPLPDAGGAAPPPGGTASPSERSPHHAPEAPSHPLPPSLAPPPTSAPPPPPHLLRPLVPFPMLPPSKGDPSARSSASRHRSRAAPVDEVSVGRAVRDDLGYWHGFGALARSLSSLDEGRGALGLQAWRSKRRALLDLDALPDASTLTREERALCAAERYLPAQYLAVKLQVLRLQEARGSVSQDEVVGLPFAVDASRLGRLFSFFLQQGWITKAKRGGRARD